ncbi:MAG: TetR/AcrR family transcriptional regulator [Flavobacteriales bacterium]
MIFVISLAAAKITMVEEKEKKLIQSARDVFMKYGIKSVNMDDMARHLSMSKKTLYQYVCDKDELVRKAVLGHGELEDAEIRQVCGKGLNAIDELLEIMHWVVDMLQNVHPSIVFDLQKYHPEVFGEMLENRHRSIYDCMYLNMKKGQREGLYRKDFNVEAIAKVYIGRIDMIFDQKLFPAKDWSLSQVYLEMFKYHIRGIASEKGLEYLGQKLKSIKL